MESRKNTNKISVSNQLSLQWATWVIRHRYLVILLSIMFVGISAYGGRFLEFSNNYRIFFSAANPDLLAFERFQKNYTKQDNIVFILQNKNREVFTPEMVNIVENLTKMAWNIPYAIRVDSISNFQHTWAEGDELVVEDLLSSDNRLSTVELSRKRSIALAEPLLKNNLISADASTTAINVVVHYPYKDINEVPDSIAYARKLAAQLQAKHPDLTIAITGMAMLNNAFTEAAIKDIGSLIPVMYGILIIMTLLVLRSLAASISTLILIAFSSIIAIGLSGYLKLPISPISAMAPTIILTLAIADSIHILVSILNFRRKGYEKNKAIIEGIRVNFTPVSITSLTTSIGFLTLNYCDAPPFGHLGDITAIGICAAWLLSLTLLPALLSLMPLAMRTQSQTHWFSKRLDKHANWLEKHYKVILIAMLVLTSGLSYLIPKIELNDHIIKYFDEDIQFRRDADFASEHLTGIYVIEYSIDSGENSGVNQPRYLQQLDRFANWLRSQDEVVHVYSYSDIVKRLNKNMHEDDPAWYRLPDDNNLAAQYLLLYEISLPYGLGLNDRITIDKSASRVSVSLKNMSALELLSLLQRAKNWMNENMDAHLRSDATGAAVMFAFISKRNIQSMIEGNIIALLAISTIVLLILRSFHLGIISLVANALPIVMSFGLWSLLVGQVGIAAASVAAASLGIVVDDTVHFLTKYLRARREDGLAPAEAIRYAMHTVGLAILSTTMILSIGFATLSFSSFSINTEMGLLMTITIIFALLFDFVFLPALLLLGHKKPIKEQETSFLSNTLTRNTQPLETVSIDMETQNENPHTEPVN